MSKGETPSHNISGDGVVGHLSPRKHAGIVARGISEGWLQPWGIKPAELTRVKATMQAMAEGGCPKSAAVLARMHEQDIKLVELVDKTERLDAGSATDNIGVVDRALSDLKAHRSKLDAAGPS